MQIRDRIQELRRVKASQLRPHPRNWRFHPQAQRDALQGVLAKIGYADALLARELPDGALQLIDGHLRAETTPDMEVPVLIVDLDDAEATKLLALHDPLTGMAETNEDLLRELSAEVETDNEALRQLLDKTLGAPPPEDALGEPPAEIRVPETYQVMVECDDEQQQRTLYERLVGEGCKCRLLTI